MQTKDDDINVAVVDIGSNSIRMQISRVEDGSYEIIEDFKEMIRLGDSVFDSGFIDEGSFEKLLTILKEIKAICEAKNVRKIRTVATASFREASNAGYIVDMVKKEIGMDIEIIDGEKEAFFGFLGVCANFNIENSKVLITDIGGGSAEFIIADKGRILFSKSTPFGCNKLFRRYFKNDPVTDDEIINFKENVENYMKKLPMDRNVEHIICLGGTLNNISFVKNGRYSVRVGYVDRKFLKGFLRQIIDTPIEERKKIKRLEPKRADIVLPAAMLIDKIMDITQKSGFYALSGGLRTGLTIDTINKMGIVLDFQKKQHDLRILRIMQIGKKFKLEKEHAVRVNKLSMRIFEQTRKLHNLGEKERKILEAAALLHDVGNYISYSKHHKHSYYLIKNSEFIGYSPHEIELIANIARYHRKTLPKEAHENYKILNEKERYVVDALSSILRIADALDRTHDNKIHDIRVDIKAKKAVFAIAARRDILLEKNAFDRKKDLFEKTFNVKAEVE